MRWVVAAFAGAIVAGAAVRDARACGGCFHGEPPPGETETPSVVTDHRMVIAISPEATTLWDQVEYAGDPKDFAWVLPVRGEVVVGLGNDAFIDALDTQTAPTVDSPQPSCARPVGGCGGSSTAGCGSSSAGDGSGFDLGYQEDSGIFVTGRSTVGPYASVQVHGDDEGAIVGWLRDHHYVVPSEIEPILARYVAEGFDFVAVRLRPGAGVQAMEPIRVSWRGATPSLPLRMVAAGVGAQVGIKLFVIGDGRWTTSNFPSFVVDASALTWDFATQRSDYTAWRQRYADQWKGRAFALEASVDVPTYSIPWTQPPDDLFADTGTDAAAADVDVDAPSVDADADADDVATDSLVDAADSPVDTAPLPTYDAGPPPPVDPKAADVAIAFGSRPSRRVTRLRADLPSIYLDADLMLEADATQATQPRVVQVTQSVNQQAICNQYSANSRAQQGACAIEDGEGTASPVPTTLGVIAAAVVGAIARKRARRG